jgi:transcriptional regulator with XRE-family HTH domain
MIKDLIEQQNNSKNVYFSRQLTAALRAIGIEPSPSVVATQFNLHFNSHIAKPHTVRKWLLGQTQPKSETLLLLANWLKVDPKDLIAVPNEPVNMCNKVSFEFDFTDQEVISKYLSMTVKQKITVRLLIDAIADKGR